MKTINLTIVFVFFFQFVFQYQTYCQDAKKILIESSERCKGIQKGYYEMTKYIKFVMTKDTSTFSFKTYYRKIATDSIYSFAFHTYGTYNGEYMEAIYTGDDFVITNSKDSTATIRSTSLWGNELKRSKYNYNFFDPLTSKGCYPFISESGQINLNSSVKYIGEEIINENMTYHINISVDPTPLDNQPGLKLLKNVYQYWIRKSDLIPVQYIIVSDHVIYGDTLEQYEKYVLNKCDTKQMFNDSILTLESIPYGYRLKTFEPDIAVPLIAKGNIAPDWSLLSLNNEKISLSDYKGKVILIDFFYKSCYPCLLALPAIVSLYSKYNKNGLVVIGIDPVDKKSEDLEAFLSKKGVTYPVLLGSKDVVKDYHVSAYPSIYLIDRNGKIFYTMTGFGEGVEKLLENLILNAL